MPILNTEYWYMAICMDKLSWNRWFTRLSYAAKHHHSAYVQRWLNTTPIPNVLSIKIARLQTGLAKLYVKLSDICTVLLLLLLRLLLFRIRLTVHRQVNNQNRANCVSRLYEQTLVFKFYTCFFTSEYWRPYLLWPFHQYLARL